MNAKPVPGEPALIDCEICFKEIPDTAAMTEEGEDYGVYFCDLDCYGAWKEMNGNNQGADE